MNKGIRDFPAAKPATSTYEAIYTAMSISNGNGDKDVAFVLKCVLRELAYKEGFCA